MSKRLRATGFELDPDRKSAAPAQASGSPESAAFVSTLIFPKAETILSNLSLMSDLESIPLTTISPLYQECPGIRQVRLQIAPTPLAMSDVPGWDLRTILEMNPAALRQRPDAGYYDDRRIQTLVHTLHDLGVSTGIDNTNASVGIIRLLLAKNQPPVEVNLGFKSAQIEQALRAQLWSRSPRSSQDSPPLRTLDTIEATWMIAESTARHSHRFHSLYDKYTTRIQSLVQALDWEMRRVPVGVYQPR